MTYTELEYKLLLNTIPDIGPVRMNSLLNYFGTAEAVFNSTIDELKNVEGIGETLARKIVDKKNELDKIKKEIELAQRYNIKICTSDSPEYPISLKNIPDPPPVIYLKGEFKEEDINSVAIVGTRTPTAYGKEVTKMLAEKLAKYGVTIISGLARGIDTEAHRTALKSKGRTIAVLGNGLLLYYPSENKALQDEISKNGVLISEFPLKTPPEKGNFPRRNRLIAGLALGVIVVEADEKSGALITARHAIEQGKDVFAVPGSIFSKYSKGAHQLIKQGAKLIENAEDVIEEIKALKDWLTKKYKELKTFEEIPIVTEDEQKIIRIIESNPQGVSIEKILEVSNLPFGKLSQILVSLEMKRIIRSLPGKSYIKL